MWHNFKYILHILHIFLNFAKFWPSDPQMGFQKINIRCHKPFFGRFTISPGEDWLSRLVRNCNFSQHFFAPLRKKKVKLKESCKKQGNLPTSRVVHDWCFPTSSVDSFQEKKKQVHNVQKAEELTVLITYSFKSSISAKEFLFSIPLLHTKEQHSLTCLKSPPYASRVRYHAW